MNKAKCEKVWELGFVAFLSTLVSLEIFIISTLSNVK